jgi:hypothetical protein
VSPLSLTLDRYTKTRFAEVDYMSFHEALESDEVPLHAPDLASATEPVTVGPCTLYTLLFDVAVVAVVAVAVVFAPINPMLWGRLQSKALSMLCLFVWIAHNLTAIVTATAM